MADEAAQGQFNMGWCDARDGEALHELLGEPYTEGWFSFWDWKRPHCVRAEYEKGFQTCLST